MEIRNTIPVDDTNVYVKVADIYKDLEVKKPTIPDKMEPFNPTRKIINFKLVDPTKQDEPVTKFDPPIELWVLYTAEEEKKEEELREPLQLAYWNGDHWVRFKKDEHKFRFEVINGKKYGVALISEWTDPPIAWGT